ncbi:MAG: DUF2079 domain-containing protein [Ilumatobacteraceae bacterium]
MRRLRNISAWAVLAYALMAMYAAYFTALTVGIHHGLGTSSYDFGLYDQGIWLLSRGKSPFVTLMGRNLFGDHSSFILLLLVPLYWLFSSTATLLVVQSVVIALGGIPVFLYTRRRLSSDAMGAAMVAVYLLHPAVSWTNLENYHPDSFLALLVGLALYGALERKWRLFGFAVVLALLVKEDVALILVPIGVWVALRRDIKRGLMVAFGSVLAMCALIFVVMKHFTGVTFRNSWRIPFGGFRGLMWTAVRRPWKVMTYLAERDRLFYLWQILAPMGFVFIIAPEIVLTAALVLFTNILSTFWYQYHVQYHYSLVVVPALVFGTAYAIGRAPKRSRNLLMSLVLASSLISAYLWAPLPGGRTPLTQWYVDHPSVVAAQELFELIPGTAVLSAYHPLTAQLARRVGIYAFPNPFVRSLYGPDVFAAGDRLPQADDVEYVMLPTTLIGEPADVWESEQDRFTEVASNAWWILYKRVP